MMNRRQTEFELETQKLNLEILRNREPQLRAALAMELDRLADAVLRASRKIATGEWADGIVGSTVDSTSMREAEDALTECISDIKYTELQIEDLEGDLADASLWNTEVAQ